MEVGGGEAVENAVTVIQSGAPVRTRVEGVIVRPSMHSEKSWVEGKRGYGANDDDFRFIAVEFEKIVVHPGFYCSKTVCDGRENDGSDGCCGDIKLGIIGVTVKL